jgi:hypothetical protein
MPYPSTLQAVREFRHLMLLEEAARERRATSAVPQPIRKEGAMFSESYRDSIIQRGFDEALVCRDMLAPAPHQPSPLVRLCARLVAIMHGFALHKPSREHCAPPAAPNVVSTR